MRNLLARMGAMLVVLAFLAGCAAPVASQAPAGSGPASTAGPGSAPPADRPLTKIQVVFAGNLTPENSQIWIGQELGYFAEEGIDLEMITASGNVLATQIVASGAAEFFAGGPEGLLSAAAEGSEVGIKTIYNYLRRPIYSWATSPDNGITALTDLRGKKVGVASLGSGTKVFAEATLKDAGVDPATEVEILPVGTEAQAATALESGQVDALAIWDSNFAIMERVGFELSYLPPPAIASEGCPCAGIHVSERFLAENPELVQGFARAVAKGTVFLLENPEAAIQIHWKMFPETKPTNVDDATALADTVYRVEARTDKYGLDVGEDKRWGALTQAEWDRWTSFLGLAVDDAFATFYDDSFIDGANDFDAEAIKAEAQAYQP